MKSFIVAATAFVPFSALAQIDGDEHWHYDYPNLSAEPFAFETIGDRLYAGGLFLTVGGAPDAKDLAYFSYRTETWSALPDFGGNDTGGVWAIHGGDDGSVYVGGNFSSAGGFVTRGVARLDPRTETWTPLRDLNLSGGQENGPTNGRVYAIEQIGDWVYVGGEFTGPSGTPTSQKYIRRFNIATDTWDLDVGAGLTADVRALLELPDGSLLAGGIFPGGIARWDGANWTTYAGGVSRTDGSSPIVRDLKRGADGSVYVGGRFDRVGATNTEAGSVGRILSDGSWDTMAGGFDENFIQNGVAVADGVFEIAVSGETVYAGGDFDANKNRVNRGLNQTAMWTGTEWTNMGSGLGSSATQNINCIALGPDGSLYAGGAFGKGFNTSSARFGFARWNEGIDFAGYVAGAYQASRTMRVIQEPENIVKVQAELLPDVRYQMQGTTDLVDWVDVFDPLTGEAGFLDGYRIRQNFDAAFYRFRPIEDLR